jgi:methionyl-tRNA synthetase
MLAERAGLSNDHFVRTTDSDHGDAVQYFWVSFFSFQTLLYYSVLNITQHMLRERGYIYPAKHEGWYSVSDETFYPQSAVHLIVDPPTGRKIMVWKELLTKCGLC